MEDTLFRLDTQIRREKKGSQECSTPQIGTFWTACRPKTIIGKSIEEHRIENRQNVGNIAQSLQETLSAFRRDTNKLWQH